MTTKGPSKKQIIVSISQDNTNIIAKNTDKYVFNINRLLKFIKSNITADFLKYFKGVDNIIPNNILSSYLPQFKSYLKILGIPYVTNDPSSITQNQIKKVIKLTYLLNDITLVSCF